MPRLDRGFDASELLTNTDAMVRVTITDESEPRFYGVSSSSLPPFSPRKSVSRILSIDRASKLDNDTALPPYDTIITLSADRRKVPRLIRPGPQ